MKCIERYGIDFAGVALAAPFLFSRKGKNESKICPVQSIFNKAVLLYVLSLQMQYGANMRA